MTLIIGKCYHDVECYNFREDLYCIVDEVHYDYYTVTWYFKKDHVRYGKRTIPFNQASSLSIYNNTVLKRRAVLG